MKLARNRTLAFPWRSLRVICQIALIALVTPLATAEIDGPIATTEPYSVRSDPLSNETSEFTVVFGDVVEIPDAPWIRLYFSEVHLDGESFLRITSVLDGAAQILDTQGLSRWGNSSAFFNGSAVHVELVAGPGTQDNYLRIEQIAVGLGGRQLSETADPETEESGTRRICGADTRALSLDLTVCRLINSVAPVREAVCTGFLIAGGAGDDCLLSAGHCFCEWTPDGPAAIGAPLAPAVAEFNVPASGAACLPAAAIVHPPVQDQYPIDRVRALAFGVGNDWAVFQVASTPDPVAPFALKQPSVRQGVAGKALAAAVPPTPPLGGPPGPALRVTGHGADCPGRATCPGCAGLAPDDYVQQDDTGPLTVGLPALFVGYTVDTMGASSGSPVELVAGGDVIGIHTHGQCHLGFAPPRNVGTRIDHPFLVAAIAACQAAAGLPAGTDCINPATLPAPWRGISADLNYDCNANEEDFAIFVATFGRAEGDPDFNADADYDGDGIVSLVDYQIWLNHFRAFVGDPQAGPPRGTLGDFDGDGDLDLVDFVTFAACFGGAGRPPSFPCLMKSDFDDDGDVDLADFATFAANFGASN